MNPEAKHRKVWPIWCPAVDCGDPRYYGKHRLFAVMRYDDPAQWFQRNPR